MNPAASTDEKNLDLQSDSLSMNWGHLAGATLTIEKITATLQIRNGTHLDAVWLPHQGPGGTVQRQAN